MRITNIIQGTNLGGMEQASLRLMIGLKAIGHKCHVISLTPLGGLEELLRGNDIPSIGLEYKGAGGWKNFFPLRKIVYDTKPDAILMTGQNFIAMLAIWDICIGRKLYACHFHHMGVKPDWQWKIYYLIANRIFRAITFPSDLVKDEAIAILPKIRWKSYTIRNPIIMPPLPSLMEKEHAKRLLGIENEYHVIGNAGWLIKRKRFDVFIRVAAEILKKQPNTIFLIAGDGPEKQALNILSQQLGIVDKIKWLGWIQNMNSFYNAIDLMLFNSDCDAMGLSALEAMSYGVPVVGSVIYGGLREVLPVKYRYLILKSHDVEELTRMSLVILNDETQRMVITRCCREYLTKISSISESAIWHESMLCGESLNRL